MKTIPFTLLVFSIFTLSLSAQSKDLDRQNDNLNKALETLEKALKTEGLPAQHKLKLRRQLVIVHREAKAYGSAEEQMQIVMDAQDEPITKDYISYGELLIRAEKFDQAIKTLREAEDVHPKSLEIAHLLTYPLRFAERWPDASAQYEKFATMFKKQMGRGLGHEFYFQFGTVVEKTDDLKKAEELFLKAEELIPPSSQKHTEFRANLLNHLGYMWIENDQNLDEAGEKVKQAAKLLPDSGAIADSVGWYYFKKGRYIEALNELIRAESLIETENMDSTILDHMAQTFEKIGNMDQATAYLKRAIKLAPENTDYQERLTDYQAKQ